MRVRLELLEEIGFDTSSFRSDPDPARPAASHYSFTTLDHSHKKKLTNKTLRGIVIENGNYKHHVKVK